MFHLLKKRNAYGLKGFASFYSFGISHESSTDILRNAELVTRVLTDITSMKTN